MQVKHNTWTCPEQRHLLSASEKFYLGVLISLVKFTFLNSLTDPFVSLRQDDLSVVRA